MTTKTVLVTTQPCPFCNKTTQLVVPEDGFKAWLGGQLVQHALPKLDNSQHELLVSGMHDECWKKFMPAEIDECAGCGKTLDLDDDEWFAAEDFGPIFCGPCHRAK